MIGMRTFLALFFFAISACAAGGAADAPQHRAAKTAVDSAVKPLMARDGIPGMAVGVIVDDQSYVFNYGLASTSPKEPVTNDTLFELGSVSKTLTATLASYAQAAGALSLSDSVGTYLPSLRGTAFGNVTLLDLGTHTPGGMPLQVPDDVQNTDELMAYFKRWHPTCPPGTCRTYSNLSIGTLGLIAAQSMGGSFETLMEQRLFAPLGMHTTYINVPQSKMGDYAEGYKRDGSPTRMQPGVLAAEAYGVRSTATDMLRFVAANMQMMTLDTTLRRAIAGTHVAYFTAGPLTQDLIWEQYPYPVTLRTLQQGNAPVIIFNPTPATKITPPQAPQANAWLNKTGSTNGFGAYVAFIPEKRLGIVILANKNFPIADRVSTAYQILTALANVRQ